MGIHPPSDPSLFVKVPSSVCGPEDPIRWSQSITTEVDLEVELGVVMGRDASRVSPGAAHEFIFGYTVINDVTARDIQRREQQWVRSKSLDSFCPMGPVIVTRDELPDPQSLELQSRVNGTSMQRSSTREMVIPVHELVSRLSHSFTLRAGDVIATGTPWGVGAFKAPPVFLKEGDVVEVEVRGIGVLRNICVVD
jgi:5-carboxymethyl-2-hydroxymuconate isomerase